MITRASRMCIVRENIAKGYGVEDISVMFGLPLHCVQFDVQQLRENGDLRHMFGAEPSKFPIKAAAGAGK